MEHEFLKRFCNTQRWVGVLELIEKKSRKILRRHWIFHQMEGSYLCVSTKVYTIRAVCLNNFRHDLSIAFMVQTFEGSNDLYTNAHDMRSTLISVRNHAKESGKTMHHR